jgi:pyruvate dehydrogenase E2 component (dihydrolipoamide acetyltransferase)
VVIGEPTDAEAESTESTDRDTEPHAGSPEATTPAAAEATSSAAPIVGTLSEDAEVLSPRDRGTGADREDSVKALPIVRKLAREMGVDLAGIEPSGPDRRVTREDVLAAASPAGREPTPEPEAPQQPAPAPEPETVVIAAATPAPLAGGGERRPLSRLRRTIAGNMSRSWAEVPHVTTFDDVDATRLLEIRSALAARHEMKIPIEALVVKAVIPALQAFPEFNATLDGDDLMLHGRHDIGIAVDTPDGLLVAVIKDAGARGVLELAGEVRRLGDGAKARSLGPDELTGQTFTVSNIGAVGGGHGTPIIPFGTTAILSVGRAKEKVIATEGELAIATLMPLSLSYDHRVIDGAQGRRFMSLVIENLEEPALFLAG